MIRKILIISLSITISTFILLYTGLRIWISSDVEQACRSATSLYEGDPVEAMITYLGSDAHSYADKNNIIWALGKLKDERALPVLNSMVTGTECNHREFVCQRTLETAIGTISGKKTDIMTFPGKARKELAVNQ